VTQTWILGKRIYCIRTVAFKASVHRLCILGKCIRILSFFIPITIACNTESKMVILCCATLAAFLSIDEVPLCFSISPGRNSTGLRPICHLIPKLTTYCQERPAVFSLTVSFAIFSPVNWDKGSSRYVSPEGSI